MNLQWILFTICAALVALSGMLLLFLILTEEEGRSPFTLPIGSRSIKKPVWQNW